MLSIQIQFAEGQPTYDAPLIGPEDKPASLRDESNNTLLVLKAHDNYSEIVAIDLNKAKIVDLEGDLRAIDVFSLKPNNIKHLAKIIRGETYERAFKSTAGKGKLIVKHIQDED